MVPLTAYQLLAAIEGLRAGRSAAKETEPVRPVDDSLVDVTLPYLTPPLRAMAQLQRCTGALPGEICAIRGIDLETSGDVWVYRPGSDAGPAGRHKTGHRGHQRVILIGSRGQEILRPWLRLNVAEYLFQPLDGRAAFDADRRANRKTKRQPSQAARQPKKNPQRKPRDHYTTSDYGHAVGKACIRAHVAGCPDRKRWTLERGKKEPRKEWQARVKKCAGLAASLWHPHQLRHTRATELRREAGIDTARAVLGHHSPAITALYAAQDMGKAAGIMQRLG
jgi:integrase